MTLHHLNGRSYLPPFDNSLEQIIVGMGCFWGVERRFWQQSGVYVTAVGYVGGQRPNPSYEQVCSGATGHVEVALVVFDPKQASLPDLLKVFWESHDPTQGDRQGNDIGTQYRSVIFCQNQAQFEIAEQSKKAYQQSLDNAGMRPITTEVALKPEYYGEGFNYAEDYHQQYLSKNPHGYCGLRGTGVSCSF